MKYAVEPTGKLAEAHADEPAEELIVELAVTFAEELAVNSAEEFAELAAGSAEAVSGQASVAFVSDRTEC